MECELCDSLHVRETSQRSAPEPPARLQRTTPEPLAASLELLPDVVARPRLSSWVAARAAGRGELPAWVPVSAVRAITGLMPHRCSSTDAQPAVATDVR